MSINRDLTEALDVSPIETQEIELYKPDQETDEEKLQADLEYARNNLYEVIESSKDALKDLVQLAKTAEHPKVYEALSGMIKAITDVNKDLLGMQKFKKDITGKDIAAPVSVTNNNVFLGSTAELLEKIVERAKLEKASKVEIASVTEIKDESDE